MIRKIGMVAIAVLLAGNSMTAQEVDNAEDGKALVEDFLNNVVTMSGRFEQQLVDVDNAIVEESSGTLDIRRPGQFRWSYADPYQQVLIADGLNIWSYDVDLEQVVVKDQSAALGSTPAILLGGSSDVLDDFDYIGSFSDRGTVWVRLRPKDLESGFNKVEMGFTNGDLSRMLFTDSLEQTTLIALLDVRFNEAIDEQVFSFEPPAGVDVVGEPIKKPSSNN